ncbi:MAG TPA: polyprenyl diphosphate synthase [Phycisphaerales bacterium]|nr:polyprenyl diphosphate synthase [Phycisphaerales bacterium]
MSTATRADGGCSGPAHPAAPIVPDAEALRVVGAMRARSAHADPLAILPDVHPARIPRHIAIIMDGNGRWAQQRGFPRFFGHRNGAASVRAVIEECGRLGVECLTLYSFSLENWKRPDDEVTALMQMYEMYLEGERERIVRENIRFVQIGRRQGLPAGVIAAVDRLTADTAANTGPTLCLAVNYGSRGEITDAARALAAKAARGELDPGAIDERVFENHLYTAGLPDPDLLIRTAGERRLSNYLLWQLSYAEIYVTDVLWPDFGAPDLHAAIRDFAGRTRRFGAVDPGHQPDR